MSGLDRFTGEPQGDVSNDYEPPPPPRRRGGSIEALLWMLAEAWKQFKARLSPDTTEDR